MVGITNPRPQFAAPRTLPSFIRLSRSIRNFLFTAVLVGASGTATAQAPGAINCAPGGHPATCEVRLASGQTSTTVRFRPVIPAGGPAQTFSVQGTGVLDTLVTAGGDGTAEFRWRVATAPMEPLMLLVETRNAPIAQRDTITVFPFSAQITSFAQNDLAPYVWLRNSWIPIHLRIGVSPTGGRLSREQCEAVRFSMQPLPKGEAAPDSGRATWAPGTGRFNCLVVARWRLADVAGRQELAVRIGDSTARVPGIAREGPRIVAGVAHFTRVGVKDTRYCESYTQSFAECHQDRTSSVDTVQKKKVTKHQGEWQPVFGVEVPVLLTRQATSWPSRLVQSRLRLVAGSTFNEPLENFFIGFAVLPVAGTEFESLPIQLQAAWRYGGGFLGGVTVDGSGLLSGALKALGAPF